MPQTNPFPTFQNRPLRKLCGALTLGVVKLANLLRESLEAVQQTAAVILGGIAPEPAALAVAA